MPPLKIFVRPVFPHRSKKLWVMTRPSGRFNARATTRPRTLNSASPGSGRKAALLRAGSALPRSALFPTAWFRLRSPPPAAAPRHAENACSSLYRPAQLSLVATALAQQPVHSQPLRGLRRVWPIRRPTTPGKTRHRLVRRWHLASAGPREMEMDVNSHTLEVAGARAIDNQRLVAPKNRWPPKLFAAACSGWCPCRWHKSVICHLKSSEAGSQPVSTRSSARVFGKR